MNDISDKLLAEIEAECAKWEGFLNMRVGALAAGLGISSLGTPSPFVISSLALLFMALFTAYGSRHFPKKIRDLRKCELAGMEEIKFLGIEAKYFGYKALLKNFPVYFVGMVSLSVVWFFSGLSVI